MIHFQSTDGGGRRMSSTTGGNAAAGDRCSKTSLQITQQTYKGTGEQIQQEGTI
jgi:hypothetical protein